MKHAIEKAIEALEPLAEDDRMLAVRLAGRKDVPIKRVKRKYTKRKALGEGITPTPEIAPAEPEPVKPAVKAKPPVKKGGLAALKSKAKARPLRSAGSGESE